MRAAALIYGPHVHHLDHLGPLCQILNIPLFLTDEEIFEQTRLFYPALDARLCSPLDVGATLLQDHQAVISCLSKTLIAELFFFAEHALGRKVFPIWCPHGSSDKGHHSGFLKFLAEEKAAFVYGPQLISVFKANGAWEGLRGCVVTGNYRLADYRARRSFYDQIAHEYIQRKLPPGRTFLFAPTWSDSEGQSAFDGACEILLKSLPEETNLIIKLHPNTYVQEERIVERLHDQFGGHKRVLFLDRYPHIYSLLSLCDLYIGDVSSIGYDFLSFDRPMVFLNQRHFDRDKDPAAALFRGGIVLPPSDYPRIYSLIDEVLPYDNSLFSVVRKELYNHAFGMEKSPDELRDETNAMLRNLAEELEFM